MATPAPFWPDGPLTAASLDLVALLALGATAAAYLAGVLRLRRRGRTWPGRRVLAFAAGLACLAVATQSGLATGSPTWFSAHVVEHLLVAALGPLLLVLGAPFTLAAQAGNRRLQLALVELGDLPVARAARRPLPVLGGFTVVMVALNLPTVVAASRASSTVHLAAHLAALTSGLAFASLVTAADPAAWRVPPAVRAGVALVTIPAHAFVALGLLDAGVGLSDAAVLGAERALADQRLGVALLWVGGDLIGLALTVAALVAWVSAERRAAARHDRRHVAVGAGGPST